MLRWLCLYWDSSWCIWDVTILVNICNYKGRAPHLTHAQPQWTVCSSAPGRWPTVRQYHSQMFLLHWQDCETQQQISNHHVVSLQNIQTIWGSLSCQSLVFSSFHVWSKNVSVFRRCELWLTGRADGLTACWTCAGRRPLCPGSWRCGRRPGTTHHQRRPAERQDCGQDLFY